MAETTPSAEAAPLVFRTTVSRIAVLLLPLGLAGLAAGAVGLAHKSPDAWAAFVVGLVFTFVGLVFLAGRRVLVVEPHRDRWRYAKGLLDLRAGRLADLARVRLTPRVVPDASLVLLPHYLVALEPETGPAMVVADEADRAAARRIAASVARRLRLPLWDEAGTAGAGEPPEALDAALARRLGGPPDEAASADSPPGGVVTGEAVIELPPAGLRGLPAGPAMLAFGLAAFLVAAHLIAFTDGARTGLGFAAFALPFDIACAFALVHMGAGALGRQRVAIEAAGVEVSFVALGRSWRRWRAPLDALAALGTSPDGREVRLLTDERVVALGRGLDDSGRAWLTRALHARLGRAALAGLEPSSARPTG
jgi:hypothetical protein